jgi:hypothetical protein
MGRETHMRTYQKHAALSMMSRHLAIPCQFPAVIQESARKVLIFLESAPDMERIFCFSLLAGNSWMRPTLFSLREEG